MRKYARYLLILTITFFIGLAAFAFWYSAPAEPRTEASADSSGRLNTSRNFDNETLLSETENAYNPIPNSDGSLIAYVRTGRSDLAGGLGRASIVSGIAVMDAEGNIQTGKSLADCFLSGWSADSQSLNCFGGGIYSTVSLDGKILKKGKLPFDYDYVSERTAFLPNTDSVLWLQNYYTSIKNTGTSPSGYSTADNFVGGAIQSNKGEIVKYKAGFDTDSVIALSPDGRYLAIASAIRFGSNNNLLIYDRQKSSFANLGVIIIHPDASRDYIKPAWDPWFADSSKLVFATASGITVSSPDGKSKRVIARPQLANGLAVPSPSGDFVAFATFEPTVMKRAPDHKFWGNSIIWTVPVSANSKPHPVTKKNENETLSLRWLNNSQLVFDRIADEFFYENSRLWKVDISR